MRILTLLIVLSFVNAYSLLNNVECIIPKILRPCEGINLFFLQTSQEVVTDLRQLGLSIFIAKSINATGNICNEVGTHYGFMTQSVDSTTTNITISNELFSYPNTLYNVILHEILHSLGLDHDEEPGLMSYAVTLSSWFGSIKNDCRKLWISKDDINGIIKSCFNRNGK